MTLLGQSGPIGIVSLVFAGLYFYLLPRASVDHLPPLSASPRTGLSESLSLGEMGKLLQDSMPVLRLSFRDEKTGKPYRLDEPPYIRGTVVCRYFRKGLTASFESADQTGLFPTDRFRPLNSIRYFATATRGDRVNANFEILSPDGSLLPCIAPMLNHDARRKFIAILPFEWRLINNRSDRLTGRAEANYTLMTTAFRGGREWPVLADSRALLEKPSDRTASALLESLSTLEDGSGPYTQTGWIEDLIARVRERHPEARSPVALAKAVENYLSMSGEFTYSLDLERVDEELDPIEDFVVNLKHGHCQYFAAALTMVLRYEGIPARIVLGYHPLEYNEIGDYFTVRRSDAHAWVEAHFTSEQLREAGFDAGDLAATGGWLRLDATPAGPGSNAGSELRAQQDQAADYAQRIWKDYVLNSRQRAEESSFYGPLQDSARRTYRDLIESGKELIKRMRDSQFVGGAINQETWFSWPIAILIMLVGAALVLLWRIVRWLPRLAPRLAKKLGLGQGLDDVRQHFYRQCLRLLHRAGFVRQAGQTADEYTSAAAEKLAISRHWAAAPQELAVLTAAYYRLRFGGSKTLRAEEQRAVAAALDEMERKLK
jgi:transglutaminase-like putative cysteine protease